MKKTTNLTGKNFERLTVIKKDNSKERIYWICNCNCGTQNVSIRSNRLKSGLTKSCGCYQKEEVSKSNTKHGMSETKEYNTWENIISRCINSNNNQYKYYGGRGITICNRWKDSFENFYEDMGPRPGPEYSIDRIDNNGNYESSNCRWTTHKEQMRNTRKNVINNMEEANQLRNLYKEGISRENLAIRFGCSYATVTDIILNRTWTT